MYVCTYARTLRIELEGGPRKAVRIRTAAAAGRAPTARAGPQARFVPGPAEAVAPGMAAAEHRQGVD
eukprot:1245045-Lingulodinium_polyedra.AAC.1